MLSTSSRFTQTLDPTTGVARVRSTSVSRLCGHTAAASAAVSGYPTANAFGGSWTLIERKPMPMVDLHRDRWPLQSTS